MNAPDLNKASAVISNPWAGLRQFTAARIALGRAGVSLPTAAHLAFQLAHAQARDAVHAALDSASLSATLAEMGARSVVVESAAVDRSTYLQRPDLGRSLSAVAQQRLAAFAPTASPDIAFVMVDGLSALAVQSHATALYAETSRLLCADGLSIAPVVIVHQGRVAIGDEIGAILRARIVVVLIGERPGLSSPDSLGVYITYGPRPGCVDAQRNCISNVRPAGLPITAAAHKLCYLLRESHRRAVSGVELKDEADVCIVSDSTPNFLLAL